MMTRAGDALTENAAPHGGQRDGVGTEKMESPHVSLQIPDVAALAAEGRTPAAYRGLPVWLTGNVRPRWRREFAATRAKDAATAG